MSRRRAQGRRWHIGESCRRPQEIRMAQWGRTRTDWLPAVVTAVRGDRVVVTSYGWEYLHPWWELRDPPSWKPWRYR